MNRTRSNALWTFVVTSIALFMVALDNLVVTTALPVIKADLGASLADLQWMVNAYTLTFAVLLITGAALGDRFGREARLPHRHGDLHRRLGARRAGPDDRDPDPRAGHPGRRRGDRHAADPDHPVRGDASGTPRGRARCLGRDRRPRDRHRSAGRWRDRRRASTGTGSSGSTCRSGSSSSRWPPSA